MRAMTGAVSLQSLDLAEKIVLSCCAVAAIFCFLPWYSVEFPEGFREFGAKSPSKNGFQFWEGVLVFLLSLATGAAVWAEKSGIVKLEKKTMRLLPLAGCGLAVLFLIVYIASGEETTGLEILGVEAGNTAWPYLSLIAMAGAAYFAFTRVPKPAVTGG